MRWLFASTIACGLTGLAGLVWLGTDAWVLIFPLAGLAAAPLLRLQACTACRSRADPALDFCPGCARPN